jgi:hypothetical protein
MKCLPISSMPRAGPRSWRPRAWRSLAAIVTVFTVAGAVISGAVGQSALGTPLDVEPAVGYFIAAGNPEEHYRPGDRRLAEWALEAWRRAAGTSLQLAPSPEPTAHVRVYWAGPLSGQYGEMRSLIVGGRRGAAVFIRPDTNALGPEIAALAAADPLLRETIVYLTCVHELGHAFGLEHTADYRDIMYSFQHGGDIGEYFSRYRRRLKAREDIARTSAMSDADVLRIRALYPGR